ncbi:hypothetical protein HZH66_014572 [Vespula vulgaris]|uniref:Uncharacterized protein n=1 Tax=Vespula vulgaris TaxID=7454 RepID=A0A834J455_VESVU|nr:hypothetical protein HZH66_014572 [Vespula vulgaris]
MDIDSNKLNAVKSNIETFKSNFEESVGAYKLSADDVILPMDNESITKTYLRYSNALLQARRAPADGDGDGGDGGGGGGGGSGGSGSGGGGGGDGGGGRELDSVPKSRRTAINPFFVKGRSRGESEPGSD